MNELIKEMQEKGLFTIRRFKFIGKAKSVFDFINILAATEDGVETDPNWWQLRLWLMRN